MQALATIDMLPGDYRILKFICLRVLRIHGKNCHGVRTIAKGIFEARMNENTEENQAFCGIGNLSHKLGLPGATPGPAILELVEYANRKSDLVQSQVILQVRLLSQPPCLMIAWSSG